MAREFDREDFVGLPYAEACSLAVAQGWKPRHLVPDEVVTLEYNADRINLVADQDDVVIDASLG